MVKYPTISMNSTLIAVTLQRTLDVVFGRTKFENEGIPEFDSLFSNEQIAHLGGGFGTRGETEREDHERV